jgi:hypothetical protein
MAPVIANDKEILELIPDADISGYPVYNYTAFDEKGLTSIQGYFRKMYIKEKNFTTFLTRARDAIQQIDFSDLNY